ncbi:DUF3558 family protein [Nocardia huaxiensis]|uniref:DUF3558 domain-containing protein n=1 Tax=Nocardia huaxiensis TaxID=2755382 RepID=A0A7D6Z0G3_9NOCA|nr:DUF3558 family protein [Nocardia huaxiensis]QLY29406.1 DUF3558 domain-containing protein [Nocardia huaxiensis]UFS97112.1 DUF3558 domain-containing protein [Nocardia huaxiensis]
MKKFAIAAAAFGAAAILLTGCSTAAETDAPPTTASPSVPASVSTSPRTDERDGGTTVPTPAETTSAPATSATENPASDTALWDPCTLSDSALTGASVDTATEERVSDPRLPVRKTCKWQATDRTFELTIVASGRTIDDMLEPGTYTDLRKTEYYGRQVVIYRNVADTHKLACYVATPAAFGSIEFFVRNTRVQTDAGDPCKDANVLGSKLFSSLP